MRVGWRVGVGGGEMKQVYFRNKDKGGEIERGVEDEEDGM